MTRVVIGWLAIAALLASAVSWEWSGGITPGDDAVAVGSDLDAPPPCPCEDGQRSPGEPCSDGCMCPCCPALVLAPEALADHGLQPPPPARQSFFPRTRRLNPANVHFRIFHPPRFA